MNKDDAQYFLSEFTKLLGSPNHRYLSWEHCYTIFSTERLKKSPDIDLLSLHLGFYLASWGMMRGSSQLLQKDYKIHTGAINILLKPQYIGLWDKTWKDSKTDKNELDLLFNEGGLVKELSDYYKKAGISPTETLITKILLGTIGCVPAYDRFLKTGLGADGKIQQFGRKSMEKIIDTYGISSRFSLPSYNNYPQMKIIDSIFWQYGYYLDEIEKALKANPYIQVEVVNTRHNPKINGTLAKGASGYSINGGPANTLANVVKNGWHVK